MAIDEYSGAIVTGFQVWNTYLFFFLAASLLFFRTQRRMKHNSLAIIYFITLFMSTTLLYMLHTGLASYIICICSFKTKESRFAAIARANFCANGTKLGSYIWNSKK